MGRLKNTISNIALLALLGVVFSCVDPFPFESIVENNAVVVIEAVITDETKAHLVNISTSTSIEANEPAPISGAEVWMQDQNGERIVFAPGSPGNYLTSPDFKPDLAKTYTLFANLPDGRKYASGEQSLMPEASLDSVYGRYVELPSATDQTTSLGIQIFLDAHGLATQTNWFRYEWDNTFEIITPKISCCEWDDGIVPRSQEVNHCYRTEKSTSLILSTTEGLIQPLISELPIRFLHQDSVHLRTNYSIRIRQYSTSEAAYQYYKLLKKNNEGSGSFFDTQKGSVLGNIHPMNNSDEIVLGYFEMASVKEQRVFFKPDDFTNQGFLTPDYPYCGPFEPPVKYSAAQLRALSNWKKRFIIHNSEVNMIGLPIYNLLPILCADCTSLGTTEKPEFWEDI